MMKRKREKKKKKNPIGLQEEKVSGQVDSDGNDKSASCCSSDDDDDDELAFLESAATQWASTKERQDSGVSGTTTTAAAADDDDDDDSSTRDATSPAAAKYQVPHVATMTDSSSHCRLSNNNMQSPILSLHVTQLSFEATDYDVRSAFSKRGCAVRSVRLVYDHDYGGGGGSSRSSNNNTSSLSSSHKTFRGVAFVDVEDQDSYERALKLDRSYLLGRRINVRPTRTREELANIVQRSRELVGDRIRKGAREKESSKQEQQHPDQKLYRRQKRMNEGKNQDGCSTCKRTKRSQDYAREHTRSRDRRKEGNYRDRKLTKKERNRRAAIIMQRSKRQKK